MAPVTVIRLRSLKLNHFIQTVLIRYVNFEIRFVFFKIFFYNSTVCDSIPPDGKLKVEFVNNNDKKFEKNIFSFL